MKFTLLNVGKTDKDIEKLNSEYIKRINKYIHFWHDFVILSKSTNKLSPSEVKKLEGEIIRKKINKADYIILLDEKGVQLTSTDFAGFIQKIMGSGKKNIVFITGGAYGFSDSLYNIADMKLSLSQMTTTHQLIRLFFTEQLYRALTIIKGHPYHND